MKYYWQVYLDSFQWMVTEIDINQYRAIRHINSNPVTAKRLNGIVYKITLK
jgi:hypothetical protein